MEKGFYGTGIMALKRRPMKVYQTLDLAKQAAEGCGVCFVVEFIVNEDFSSSEEKDIRQIFAWDFKIKSRDQLFVDYNHCGEKLAILRNCHNPIWIELKTSSGQNYLFPIKDSSDEKLEILNNTKSYWFKIEEISGKNYIII